MHVCLLFILSRQGMFSICYICNVFLLFQSQRNVQFVSRKCSEAERLPSDNYQVGLKRTLFGETTFGARLKNGQTQNLVANDLCAASVVLNLRLGK